MSDTLGDKVLDEAYPLRMMGCGTVGNSIQIGVVVHQFGETGSGFKAKLVIHFPAASEPAMIEGHRHHLACEFTNWINMYLDSERLRGVA